MFSCFSCSHEHGEPLKKEGKPQGEHQVPKNELKPIVRRGGEMKKKTKQNKQNESPFYHLINFGTKDAKIQPSKGKQTLGVRGWGGLGGGPQGIVLPRMIPSLVSSSLSHLFVSDDSSLLSLVSVSRSSPPPPTPRPPIFSLSFLPSFLPPLSSWLLLLLLQVVFDYYYYY